MIPNITRGGKLAGFVAYCVGPGRFNEHTNPMVVAGDDTVLAMVDQFATLSMDDALDIARVLEHPRKTSGVEVNRRVYRWSQEEQRKVWTGEVTPAHMWQCSLSNDGAKDEPLSAEAWQRIAEEFMERMGFTDPDRANSSRWVAIHHGANRNGNDHIHIVMQMVTESGGKANVHKDYSRAQKVCAELEREFGLSITEGRAANQTLSGDKRGELERAGREGRSWTDRRELRRRLRSVVAASNSEAEFVQKAFGSGIVIRPRFERGNRQKVVGYSVALPAPAGAERDLVFYSPSKLDKNLSLPAVRQSLGAPEGGDPAALGAWQEHHATTRTHTRKPAAFGVSSTVKTRIYNGDATAVDLSRVFAAGAFKFERDTHGELTAMSDAFAQVALSPTPHAYLARLRERAGSRNAAEGWRALLMQAARLGRVMAQSEVFAPRPELVDQIDPIATAMDEILPQRTKPARQPKNTVRSPVQTLMGMTAAPNRDAPTTRASTQPRSVHESPTLSRDTEQEKSQ